MLASSLTEQDWVVKSLRNSFENEYNLENKTDKTKQGLDINTTQFL